MSPDVVDRLTEHDPATGLDATPPEDLLHRLLAEPRPAPASRRPLLRRRPVRAVLALVVVGTALAGVSIGTGGSGSPDLAARAYAQLDQADAILYVRLRGTSEVGGRSATGTTEHWAYGREVHRIITEREPDGTAARYDQLLAADGTLRNLMTGGGQSPQLQVTRPGDRGDGFAFVLKNLRDDFAAEFREQYERGVLDDSGESAFAGRRARRYVVAEPEPLGTGRPPIPGRVEFFVDAATGAPLGSRRTVKSFRVTGARDGRPVLSRTPSYGRWTVVVEAIERLPVTAGNLAKVRTRDGE